MNKHAFIKYIESYGFKKHRTGKSHDIYINEKNEIFPVPISHSKIKKGIIWNFNRRFVKKGDVFNEQY
jgi:predicted RNA binding protein YcfA (HicA-like mRNA interferase family)